MPGGTQPPYRMPCQGISGKPRIFLRSAFQHGNYPVTQDRYVNTTMIDNFDRSALVAPYPLYLRTSTSFGSCEAQGTPISDNPWSPPFSDQTFDVSGTVTTALCRKVGLKTVQAMVVWHGDAGFMSELAGWSDVYLICPGTLTCAHGDPRIAGCVYGDGSLDFADCGAANPECNSGSGGPVTCDDGVTDPVCRDLIHPYRRYQSSPDQVKYRTRTMVASYDGHEPVTIFDPDLGTTFDADLHYTADITIVQTVDRYSGLVTRTCDIDEESYYIRDDTHARVDLDPATHACAGIGCGLIGTAARTIIFDDLFLAVPGDSHVSATLNPTHQDPNDARTVTFSSVTDRVETMSDDISNTSYSWSWSEEWHGAGNGQELTYTGSITFSDPLTAANVYADMVTLLAKWDLTDDVAYPWRTDDKPQVAPLVSRDSYGQTSPSNYLTSSCTIDDYRSPIANANGDLPFTDEWQALPKWTQMDWRDPRSFRWVFPDGTFYTTAAATDIIDFSPSGKILGIPLPAAFNDPDSAHYSGGGAPAGSYEDFFDFRFINYKACVFGDGGGVPFDLDWYAYASGQDASSFNVENDTQIPKCATQWTNRKQAINKPTGAWVFLKETTVPAENYNQETANDNSALWGCKYAETVDLWPSQNFARPAGADKFAFDEDFVVGLRDYDGVDSFIPQLYLVDVTSIDPSGIWGGPAVGGFYSGCSFDGTRFHLGTKEFSVPSDWQSASGDTSVCVGRLRFTDAPSLLGAVAVRPDTAGTTLAFVSPQTNFGLSPAHTETVDLLDASHTIISTVTATRVDDSHFTIAAPAHNARFAIINGNPAAWYVSDDHPKGDLAVLDWTFDLRTNGEFTRLAGVNDCSGTQVDRPDENNGFSAFNQAGYCVPFVPCAPKVVCVSPNGETFDNGVTVPFPESMTLDSLYGSKWQALPITIMTDLLWQTPHKPVESTTASWDSDDVTCKTSDEDHGYYRHAPQVECLIVLPNNYGLGQNEPPPDPGVTIGFLSPVDHAGDGVAYPPTYIGFDASGIPTQVSTAWRLHQLFCAAPTNPSCASFDYAGFADGC